MTAERAAAYQVVLVYDAFDYRVEEHVLYLPSSSIEPGFDRVLDINQNDSVYEPLTTERQNQYIQELFDTFTLEAVTHDVMIEPVQTVHDTTLEYCKGLSFTADIREEDIFEGELSAVENAYENRDVSDRINVRISLKLDDSHPTTFYDRMIRVVDDLPERFPELETYERYTRLCNEPNR